MSSRFTPLPDERFAALGGALDEQIGRAAGMILAENFTSFLDPLMRAVLTDGLEKTGAHEGSVWLLDKEREHLVAAFNNGPRAAEWVGTFRQPLRTGIISLVLASEQPFCENSMHTNQQQDRTLDTKLSLQTCAMLAVPFGFGSLTRGVLSCVKLRSAATRETPDVRDLEGFAPEDLAALQFTATLLSRLVDGRLLALVTGREHV